MMTYEKIDVVDMEVEIEKGIFKARYELMNRNNPTDMDDDESDKEDDEEIKATDPLDIERRVLDFSKLRVTDIPTCSRVIAPPPGTIQQETQMNGFLRVN